MAASAAWALLGAASPARAQAPAEEEEIPAQKPAVPPPNKPPQVPPPAAPTPVPLAVPPSKPPPAAPPAPLPPPATPPPAPVAPPPATPSPSTEIEALRREMREERAALKARIEALENEAAHKAAPVRDEAPPEKPGFQGFGGALPGRGAWALGAYLQTQYEQHQSSSDQIAADGSYLNQDRFLVRRGRLRFDAAWEYLELAMELDGNTTNGPVFGPRRLNASLVWRGRPWEGRIEPRGPRAVEVPLARLTVGLTSIPFGFELADSHRDRVFLERSTASQAFFPGEQDVGAVLTGGVGFFRYALAATNGVPLDDRSSFPVGDPKHAKDLSTRLGVDINPLERLCVSGGVSALYGSGYHTGTSATKAGVSWVDLNGNGQIDAAELTGVPGAAATPSASFSHWAVGLDLQLSLRTPLGTSMLYGEATLASNLDRGRFVADPVVTGVDVRELGFYAAFVQEVTRYGFVGFRFDAYDPNADFLRSNGGKLLPTSRAIQTFSPVVGVQLPDRARLLFQYNAVRNLLGLDTRGVPTSLAMDHFAIRLQVQL